MIQRDLGDGLVLRRAAAADIEALVDCNGAATGNWETGEPDEGTAIWTRDLLEGRHPNVSPGEFTIVEDTSFLRHIAPVLEQRLAESAIAGHTGELEISFYRDGLRLGFEQGRLARVERWLPDHPNHGDARLPDLTFLQLLFGYRSLEELEYAFADCGTRNDEVRALLDFLFPKQASNIHTIE